MKTSKSEKATMLLQNIDSLLGGESSVELTQTSRGTNWKIKIYHPNPHEAITIAHEIYQQCKTLYGEVSE